MEDQIKVTLSPLALMGEVAIRKPKLARPTPLNPFISEREKEAETSSEGSDKKTKFNVFKNIPPKPFLDKKAEEVEEDEDDLNVLAFIRTRIK